MLNKCSEISVLYWRKQCSVLYLYFIRCTYPDSVSSEHDVCFKYCIKLYADPLLQLFKTSALVIGPMPAADLVTLALKACNAPSYSTEHYVPSRSTLQSCRTSALGFTWWAEWTAHFMVDLWVWLIFSPALVWVWLRVGWLKRTVEDNCNVYEFSVYVCAL